MHFLLFIFLILIIVSVIKKSKHPHENDTLCPHCGNYFKGNPAFCPHCGESQRLIIDPSTTPAALPNNHLRCPFCHTKISDDFIFCPNCKKQLQKKTEPDMTSVTPIINDILINDTSPILKQETPLDQIRLTILNRLTALHANNISYSIHDSKVDILFLNDDALEKLTHIPDNDLEISIRALKSALSKCPYCGNRIDKDLSICPFCKASQPSNHLYISDRKKLSISDTTKELLKSSKPPAYTIKTAFDSNLKIKPICTNINFISHFSLKETTLDFVKYATSYTVIDFETANMYSDSICQIGIVVVENQKIVLQKNYLVRPPYNNFRNKKIHGISLKDVENAPSFLDLWSEIEHYIKNQLISAYYARFDIGCLIDTLNTFNIPIPSFAVFDILETSRSAWKEASFPNFKLQTVAQQLNIPHISHNAESDAVVAAKIQIAAMEEIPTFQNTITVIGGYEYIIDSINNKIASPDEIIKHGINILNNLDSNASFEHYKYFLICIEEAIKNGLNNARICKLCGLAYENYGYIDKAIYFYELALSINENIGVKSKLKNLYKT